jgi:hypothetical protein
VSRSRSPLCLQRFVFTLADADHHTEDWSFVLGGNKTLLAHFDLARKHDGASTSSGK